MVTNSTLPPQSAFLHAILQHLLRTPDGARRRDIHEAMPDLLNLTEAQRTERLANLKHLRYRHRSGWGLSMLKVAGYVDNPVSGLWSITDRGRELLIRYPDGFDDETARQVIRESRAELRVENDADANLNDSSVPTMQPPDEKIDAALKELHHTITQELLEKIGQAPPSFFEGLVLDVLHALGYGGSKEDLERVGHSGDGGIDGIISLDKLGFGKIYVQAKRWQASIGRPEVQGFYGALAGRRAKKGVFITTSSFTREARAFVDEISEKIVLIDGAQLTSLMIEHGVGVNHYRVLRLPRVDNDYFEAY